jgi:uncharacterized membrane protein YqjE
MEQMINNIWQLNALIGGILLFLFLIFITLMLLVAILFAPFRRNNDD